MAFDTILQATWSELDQDINTKIHDDRQLLETAMKDQEKISPTWEMISNPGQIPFVVHRGFTDIDAANEWITGITAICQNHNVTPPVFEIL
jgi:hypothetical protein